MYQTFNSRNVCVSWVGIMRHKIFVDTHQYCLKIILKHYLFQYIMDIYLCSVFIYCINTDTDYWWPILTNISSAENCTLAKSVSSLLSQASSQVQSWENTHQRSVWNHISYTLTFMFNCLLPVIGQGHFLHTAWNRIFCA